ncbi:zf-HC2 domain-containing protein [Streptomyces sp. PSKA54]|uniref:Zf-HC2 domain-containing protein n=1 Tax=Streptomyces himalayensis subsp. aureolus TaxID=2758039 RepID=A0A7W2D2M3_9ACTN|nr:zf-HC2 domain-containing protein [Streptomyces himalayensis]MBA4863630.1 zf-HC2 domain-containing protein [Streptomyces himalayensis subsp. aureolus]
MANDVTCETLRENGAELALGVLPGRERAEAVAHLDRCADCREYIEQLTLVGDGLIGLLPGSEPPVGFETRVARALTQASAGREGRRATRGFGRLRRGFRGRRPGRVRLRVAAAAAALALALGFGGWAVGTAIENWTSSPPGPAESTSRLLSAELTGVGPDRPEAGEIYAHAGAPGWIYMSVDLDDAGIPYTGEISCLLERTDGTTVRVGTFPLHDGYGYWGALVDVDPSTLSGARLTSADGTVLAVAHFETAS